ncbi:MAG: hypothetical protein IKE63_05295 [Bacilli bacterium]|nr:hypothetical protein [Bacilli bacterium]
MSKKKSKSKNKKVRRDKYIDYFDPDIFDKLVNIKDLTYEELLVLEEEMKNNLFFSTNSEMMSYIRKEKAFREFKMNHPEIEPAEMYPEFIKVYRKRKENKK